MSNEIEPEALRYALDLNEAELTKRESKIERLEAELADWQRHGVRVTEDCETCEGSGERYCSKHGDSSHPDCVLKPCPDCGGTGKKPRDGVVASMEFRGGPPYAYEFPAEWLEAE